MNTNKRRQAWIIIGLSVLFIFSILLGKQIFGGSTPVCDPDVKSKTVILIDHSQGVSTQTSEAIVNRAWNHIDKQAKTGELVSVYLITQQSKTNLHPVFESCKPRANGSAAIENVKKVHKDFENFKSRLTEELTKSIGGSSESPIAQSIIDLSLDDKHFRSSELTSLLVFSDFWEYTPKFSLYSCPSQTLCVDQFRLSRKGAEERPHFENVDVQMHIIPRENISSGTVKNRAYFWNWFFGDSNGNCRKASCLNPDNLPG